MNSSQAKVLCDGGGVYCVMVCTVGWCVLHVCSDTIRSQNFVFVQALLYYTFAALGGHYFAQMTMVM